MGLEPSISARQRVGMPLLKPWYTTHLPSGEHCGNSSSSPFVNCLGLSPLISIRHTLNLPAWFEENRMYRPSGDTVGSRSTELLEVSCFWLPPFASMIQISGLPFVTEPKTIRPSGVHATP